MGKSNAIKRRQQPAPASPGLRHFAVTAKCGHVGRNRYMPIEFCVRAESGKEAARRARSIPRVKHDHPDCILGVREVGADEAAEIGFRNRLDPYLAVGSRREQNLIMPLIEHRLVDEPAYVRPCDRRRHQKEHEEAKAKAYHPSGSLLRNPKRYANRYAPGDDWLGAGWDTAA